MLFRSRYAAWWLVCAVALCALPARAQTPGLVRPAAEPDVVPAELDVVRLISSTPAGARYEFRAPAQALAHPPDAGVTLDLPTLAAPDVQVVEADYDEGPLPAGADVPGGAVAEAINVGLDRGRPRANLRVRWAVADPERGTLRRYRRVVVDVRFRAGASAPRLAVRDDNPHVAVTRSVLADGTWLKVPVRREGIYRLDRRYFSDAGLDDVDLARVAVFGNGGQPVPAITDAPRPADLVANPVWQDGDAVYFYGAAPHRWEYSDGAWRHHLNPFSFENYYFVRVGGEPGPRVPTAPYPDWSDAAEVGQIVGRAFVEDERTMLEFFGSGSGLDWLGVEISPSRREAFLLADSLLPGMAAGTARFRARVAGASGSVVGLSVNGSRVDVSRSLSSGAYTLATPEVLTGEAAVSAGQRLTVRANYVSGNGRAWPDWLEVEYPRDLRAEGGYLRFHTPGGAAGRWTYVLTGFASPPQVWDVTDPGAITRLDVREGGGAYRVQVSADAPRELVAFTAGVAGRPAAGAPVANQNLHAAPGTAEYVILTHRAFREQADALAAYRESRDGLRSAVYDIEEVFNEFSGGLVDMRAQRDFLRFLYDKGRAASGEPALRYVLFFGDGHYDFRGIKPGASATNFVPVYETQETFDVMNSYTSDDYFAMLDPGEGNWGTGQWVDVGVGRFPVRTAADAEAVVAKLRRYEDPAAFGAWRTRVTMVADDEEPNTWDLDLHLNQADGVAARAVARNQDLNVSKIYTLSYPPRQTALGRRYPDAKRDILAAFENGTLTWTYVGHGGPDALADEKLLTADDAAVLTNFDRLPIMVTATCSFGKYDIVDQQSAAELFLLSPEGGSIALMTTVRIVLAGTETSGNYGLNLELTNWLYTLGEDGRARRMGDVVRLAKNTSVGSSLNNRKFNLLGDPAMRVGLPERAAEVAAINGTPVTSIAEVPELRALERVTVEGTVVAPGGGVDAGFNGTAELTVYDAAREVQHRPVRDNDPDETFTVRNDLLWRGTVSAVAGRWSATFVVPRDISYTGLTGRLAVYASNADGVQGMGATERVRVGGTAEDPVEDGEGPEIRLFLNDTTFVSGGLVGAEPTLVVRLRDENGVNAVGAGVGHELLLTVDGRAESAADLGRYYEADLDSYRSGTVRFPMPEQDPGPHTLELRAWDVANNPATARLDYYVAPEAKLALRNVYPYPNPMAQRTTFMFEHNQPAGALADVQLRIYSLSGRPVRTLDCADGFTACRLDGSLAQIPWDGRDEDLDPVATGVYLFKLRVQVERPTGEREVAERIERLAVIR